MIDDPLLGRQLGNFRLERVLGRGGMGQVYYGWDVKLQRPVAIKVIDLRFRNNPAYARRFVREAQAVASWHHANIAQIYHADEQSDLYYFAMEYIDGLDLGQILSQYTARGELMPQADVLRIGWALANALDYAHARDMVHRDVKPSNVIVARDDHVVLTDFGLALDMQQGSMGEAFGSAQYIAPEQARRSSDAIIQSDLYSLGIMLYEMLTGSVPFDDPSPTAVALQHITQPPPAPRSLNPSLNDETEAVLLKALSKSPNERYQTGHELITALENALEAGPALEIPMPLPPLPAGVHPRSPQPSVSQMRANEVVAAQMSIAEPSAVRSTEAKPPSLEAPSVQHRPTKPRQIPWTAIGSCLLILMIAISVTSFLLVKPLSNLFPGLAQFTNTSTVETVAAPGAQISNTSRPPDVGVVGEFTPTVAPQISAGPPTVNYPDGKRFMLFYDDNSLYFLNDSMSDVSISGVAFERLSDSDESLNRFPGSRWGQFYGTSTPTWCMAIEILDSKVYLDPPECDHNNLYLSLRTPTRDDPTVFWTAQEGSHQFRVLWREEGRDVEVARCEISAGVCEVFLP